jgi:HEAT repeat protein
MSLEEILHRLHYAEDEIERVEAAEQLGSYKGEQVILALIEAMGDEDQCVQGAAMESLKKCRPDPAPYLRAALSDARLLIRWGAVEMLVNYPSLETEEVLRLALGDESAHIRGAAARSLRDMVRESTTITELQKLLDDPDDFPRYQALLTLRVSDPQIVDEAQIIERDLHSDDPLTRAAAIDFIRKDNRQEWLDEIERLREDPDFRVSRAATWAWERLHKEVT